VEFVGRSQELAVLQRHLRAVEDGEARLVSVRGRRQVGKSRLVSEFVSRSGLPQLFVTGSRQASLAGDLESFRQDASLNCTLPGVDLLAEGTFSTWEQALRTIAAALPTKGPSIVVLDELPWLLQRDPGLDGTLQKLWDRHFEALPILMILIGSDLSVMEMLTGHARPLHGRARELVVSPLTVATPHEWPGSVMTTRKRQQRRSMRCSSLVAIPGWSWNGVVPVDRRVLTAQLADESTEVVTTGQRSWTPSSSGPAGIRGVASGGAGERTFTAIAEKSGPGPFPDRLCGSDR
jgi:hypothetical protein